MIVEWDCPRVVTSPAGELSLGSFRRRGIVLETSLAPMPTWTGVLVMPMQSWEGMTRDDIAGELGATAEHYKPVWLRFPVVRIVLAHKPGMVPPRGVCFWPAYPDEERRGYRELDG